MLDKIVDRYREGGALAVAIKALAFAYDRTVRPLLPKTEPVLLAGVPTGVYRRWGDAMLPRALVRLDIPDFEGGLVSALRAHVRPGDTVVVVGAGNGVTTAVAARAATAGRVICYEGDPTGMRATARTLEASGVAERVTLHHAVVGAAVRVYGSAPAKTLVAPSELPRCDVLELDCEGAEMLILDTMTIQPRVIAVETHGCYGAPTREVKALLERRGYDVTDLGWAEVRLERACSERDIRVLVASRPDVPRQPPSGITEGTAGA